MGSALTNRFFHHIHWHNGKIVILVADQTAAAAAAMIPQDKHVLLRAVVLPGPTDKIGKRPAVRHAGFVRLVHQDKSVLSVGPALQFVIGNLEIKFIVRIPCLCAARLDQEIHAFLRKRGGNVCQAFCRAASVCLQVCTAQVEQNIPFTFLIRGRILIYILFLTLILFRGLFLFLFLIRNSFFQ